MKLSRRLSAMMAASLVAISLAVPAAAPGVVRAARTHAGYQGTITMYAQGYNPPSATHTTPGQTVVNHNALSTLAMAWEKNHPGVTIKFVDLTAVGGTNDAYFTALRTRLTGGTAPDLFWMQSDIQTFDPYLRSGLILDLTPYLNGPNKYIPGNRRWNDAFQSPWQTYGRNASGQYATVPQNIVSTGVYYNKAITDKLHLRMPPASWAEFLQDQQKVKDAGYLAMYGYTGCLVKCHWYWTAIGSQFMLGEQSRLASLTYHPDYVPGVVTAEDWARAVTKLHYLLSKDPGFIAAIRNFKTWSHYFAPGWASDTTGDTKGQQLFASGRLAFFWDGTWLLPSLKQLKLPFPFGSFWYPPVTRATSPLAPAQALTPFGVGCICGISYAAPASLAHSPKLPLVLDWLQYITTPANDATVVNEHPDSLPVVRGAAGAPAIASLFTGEAVTAKYGGQFPISPPFQALAPDDTDAWYRDTVLYLQGATSEPDYLAQLDGLMAHSANELIAQNDKAKTKAGTWDLTRW